MTARRVLGSLLWSTVVWVALWGSPTPANLLGGVAAGALALGAVPLQRRDPGRGTVTVRPLAALRFGAFFLWALVRASAVVAWEVVTPRNRIHEGIIALPLRTRSHGVATVVANAISLTPGTLTIEVAREPLTLFVHVLHLREVDTVRRELRRLETLALRAFDPERPDAEVAA